MVCKHFIFPNDAHIFPYIKAAFQKMIDQSLSQERHISRFLNNLNISTFFLYRIEEYNAIFGQQQIENIYQTIILIETKNKHINRYITDEHLRSNQESDSNDNSDITNSDITNSLVTTESVGTFYSKKHDHYKYKHVENNSKIENLTKIHVQKCIQWCVDHDVLYYYL